MNNKNSLVCFICGRVFKTYVILSNHLRCHGVKYRNEQKEYYDKFINLL